MRRGRAWARAIGPGAALLVAWLVVGCAARRVPPGGGRPWDPWEVAAAERPADEGEDDATVSDAMLRGYQRFLRRPEVPGSPGCKFHPSCSVYARRAFARYGVIGGLLLTFDRLFIRETTADGHSYAPIWRRGSVVLYDPP